MYLRLACERNTRDGNKNAKEKRDGTLAEMVSSLIKFFASNLANKGTASNKRRDNQKEPEETMNIHCSESLKNKQNYTLKPERCIN